MSMVNDKDDKKGDKVSNKQLDDLFDDVVGERKEVPAQTKESEKPTTEAVEPKSHATHSVIDPRPASPVSAKAEAGDIWICTQDGRSAHIKEVSPEDFAWWVNDKLPGMRKIMPEHVQTEQQRRDIFEEVIAILEHWQKAFAQSTKHDLF